MSVHKSGREEKQMEYKTEDTTILNLLKHAVESAGCKLAEVDFENNVLKVDGPDDVVVACARAVAEIIDWIKNPPF